MKKQTIKMYYTPISITTVCKNGSEKFGAHAITTFSNAPDGKFFELSMHGSTKKEAKEKLIEFLSGKGTVTIEEVKKDEHNNR